MKIYNQFLLTDFLQKQNTAKHDNPLIIIKKLAVRIQKEGGQLFLVGGCVRDALLQKNIKDFDLECYGIPMEDLIVIARKFGTVSQVGKSFGILKLRIETTDIDIGLPRKEKKIAKGHNGFAVTYDPFIKIKEAAWRRDFTINALYFEPLTQMLIDPFSGVSDLNNRLLRMVDARTFIEDPLRVLRAMQFIARFLLHTDAHTEQVIHSMVNQLDELPQTRIRDEWKKLFVHSVSPSLGLKAALRWGIFSQKYSQIMKSQSTLWERILLSMDIAAQMCDEKKMHENESWTFMLSVFCCSSLQTSDEQSFNQIDMFLKKIGVEKKIYLKVKKLVNHHSIAKTLYKKYYNKSNDFLVYKEIRFLANSLYPATIREIVLLEKVDASVNKKENLIGKWLQVTAQHIHALYGKAPNIISGKDLLKRGCAPDKNIKLIIDAANDLSDQFQYSREKILNLLCRANSNTEALHVLLQQKMKHR